MKGAVQTNVKNAAIGDLDIHLGAVIALFIEGEGQAVSPKALCIPSWSTPTDITLLDGARPGGEIRWI
jgi:hypothetical protein